MKQLFLGIGLHFRQHRTVTLKRRETQKVIPQFTLAFCLGHVLDSGAEGSPRRAWLSHWVTALWVKKAEIRVQSHWDGEALCGRILKKRRLDKEEGHWSLHRLCSAVLGDARVLAKPETTLNTLGIQLRPQKCDAIEIRTTLDSEQI